MALSIAPYNTSMRIGQGFNSYTQEMCLSNAVVYDDQRPGGDHYAKGGDSQVSQIVTYCARHVTKLSQVTDAMNISACTSIKSGTVGGNAGGSFIDPDKFRESDLNYFVQCQVTNQVVMAEDVTKWVPLEGKELDGFEFTRVFGDSFISGFIEGGEFDALISVRCVKRDDPKAMAITTAAAMARLEAVFGQGASERPAQPKENAEEGNEGESQPDLSVETTITINWNGGGEVKVSEKLWSLQTVAAAAASFPLNVAHVPQRIYAILTKYDTLRSYQIDGPKNALSYENVDIYTDSLLDAYMNFKNLWKQLHIITVEYDLGRGRLEKSDYNEPLDVKALNRHGKKKDPYADILTMVQNGKEKDPEIVLEEIKKALGKTKPESHYHTDFVYPPTLQGLEKARTDCRVEMIKIVKEVDCVMKDPPIASDIEREPVHMDPAIVRRLVPKYVRNSSGEEGDDESQENKEAGPRRRKQMYEAETKPRPSYMSSWLKGFDAAKKDKLRMSEYVGDGTTHDAERAFNKVDEIQLQDVISEIKAYTDDEKINGLEISYAQSPNKILYGTTTGRPIVHGLKYKEGQRLQGVIMTMGSTASGTQAVTNLKFFVNGTPISIDAVTPNKETQIEEFTALSPVNGWSLKGLWGQTLPDGGFGRLGAIWGKEGNGTVPKEVNGGVRKGKETNGIDNGVNSE
ncbi:hypothetical protein MMC11_000968 [Xylographa trunciseda]|nr:hypothetical protein [Xylographa trunciseda]